MGDAKSIEMRALEWAASDDTGASSLTILRHMIGLSVTQGFGAFAPSDGGDLGRCLRLLRLVPEWEPRIPEMAALSNAWAALVPHWEELAALLASEIGDDLPRHKSAPKTYARMDEITMKARAADGWITGGKGAEFKAS